MTKTSACKSRGQIFVPYNGKIADITHNDVLKHTLTLANGAGTGAIAGETRKIIAISIETQRQAGTGLFLVYPNEGAFGSAANDYTVSPHFVIKDGTQRLQYKFSVANDDFDVICYGYVVEA